jgi:hypothetical protein
MTKIDITKMDLLAVDDPEKRPLVKRNQRT